MNCIVASQKDVKGSRNLIGLNDKLVDELVTQISRARSKSELKTLCASLDKHLLANYLTIPQWHNNAHRILYRDIFAMPEQQPKYGLATDAWWLK